jgi:pimeloyl-ACP methyl ester carboxylesterase
MHDLLFLHGLESGPGGTKARWLAEHFNVVTPKLSTGDWPTALAEARMAILEEKPKLIVGSSYGGALLLALVLEGSWSGPCLFIAQAGVKLGVGSHLPEGTRAILLHGTEDSIIPLDGSRLLADSSTAAELEVIPGGDHRLNQILRDGTLEGAIRRLLPMPLAAPSPAR